MKPWHLICKSVPIVPGSTIKVNQKNSIYLKLVIFLTLFRKHDSTDILLILAVCRMSVINQLCNGPRSPESLWLSGRASECWAQRSEVWFLMGTQNFFLRPTLVTRWKNIFNYYFTLKLTSSLFGLQIKRI